MNKILKDLPASFVVFLVALPLCMGIAIASGVPPALGIVTGIIAGILTGYLSGAPLQVSGPAAGLTVLVFQIVSEHGLSALGPIVLLAGALQIMAGAARIGQWFRAVNPAVIYGMLSGIGVLIISSQLHVAIDGKPGGSPVENFMALPAAVAGMVDAGTPTSLLAGALSVLTLLVIVGWDKFRPAKLSVLPAPLIAVLVTTLVAYFFKLDVEFVRLPDSMVSALNIPSAADWKILLNSTAFSAAIGLAVIASAETLLCASALRKMRSDAEVRYNKELVAQGVGNMVCGMVGALPMTGVIVRSTANIAGKAETRWSAVLHGIWLLLFVMAVPQLLSYIPMAALAAILIYTGCKLINPSIVKSLSHYGKPAVAIYTTTVVAIVVTNLLVGVLIGVAVSFARLLTLFSNLQVHSKKNDDGSVVLELKGAATFLTLPKLAQYLEQAPPHTRVDLKFDSVFYIDHACMDLIETQRNIHEQAGGSLHFDNSKLQMTWRTSEDGNISLPKQHSKMQQMNLSLNKA